MIEKNKKLNPRDKESQDKLIESAKQKILNILKNKKKKSSIIQVSIGVLAVILAILIIIMMGIVSDIQGTARIVNYTGLVRGETQRIIKLEVTGEQDDAMIQEVRSFIDGLRNGNTKLHLVYLNDTDFQNKMQELDEGFSDLYKEICLGRSEGYEKTDIISRSEDFFVICDEATGLAEKYSQKKATSLSLLDTLFLRFHPNISILNAIRFSNTAMIVEIAAKLRKRKNRLPHSTPPLIFAKILGKVIKIRLGPASGWIP